MKTSRWFLLFLIGGLNLGKIYQHLDANSHVDSARQSQIESSLSERESPSRRGKDDGEGQFGKTVTSQNENFQLEASITAQTLPPPAVPPLQMPNPNLVTKTPQEMLKEYSTLRASAQAAERWLRRLDEGNYGISWDEASTIFQNTITRNEWIYAEQILRQPFGRLVSRTLMDQRPSLNPAGLPPGQYMVLYYRSSFTARGNVSELVTMVLGPAGQWKVLTYHATG